MPADPTLLENISLFSTMDEAERAAVAALMTERKVKSGTVLFREREQGGELFIIQSGDVELSVVGEMGHAVVVDILRPGEFFGELSLIDGGTRSATAKALTQLSLFSLRRADFLGMLRRQPDATLDLMAALAKRIRRTDDLVRRHVRNPNEVVQERETFGDRVADAVARFGGSWSFIFAFGGALLLWVLWNSRLAALLSRGGSGQPFDPYPFILLNLFLSMLAAIQAPVIMMSQNRQDQKDRIRNELDYQVNVKAELEIMQLHEKVERMEAELLARLDEGGRPDRKSHPARHLDSH